MTEAVFRTLSLEFDPRGVATLTLAREEALNALDDVMIDELMWAFAVLSGDPRVRVVVLAGQGKAFSAGVDVNWMQRSVDRSDDQNLADARRLASMMQAIHECPKPVIAKVQGAAYGAGVGLCCVCDVVLAAPQSRFAISETRLGVAPAVIAPYLLNVIGMREAQRLALSGEAISAARAAELKLVSEVVADEEMDGAIERLVTLMLGNGPQALDESKALFRQLAARPCELGPRELSAQTIARLWTSAEAQEGLTAFIEKRPAVFSTKEVPRSRKPSEAPAGGTPPAVFEDSGFELDYDRRAGPVPDRRLIA
jgi:methylglutaconyl-CoA hydratase